MSVINEKLKTIGIKMIPEPYRRPVIRYLKKLNPLEKETLNIEIAHCNLRCVMCPRNDDWGEKNEIRGKMSLEMFQRIIDKVVEEKFRFRDVWFGNWGESLLNPYFSQMVCYAKSKLDRATIHVSTNLTHVRDHEAVIRSGLDHMVVSISGMTQEVYSRNHVGGNIVVVLENLNKLIEIRNKLNSKIRLVMRYHDYKYNKKDAEIGREFCDEKGIEFEYIRTFIMGVESAKLFQTNPQKATEICGEFIDLEQEKKLMWTLKDYKDCDHLYNLVSINFDGNLYRCCSTFGSKYLMGSFFDYKIKDISNIQTSDICEVCAKTPMSSR